MDGNVAYRRVYEQLPTPDSARVLVDRIWPRGVRKEQLELTEWLRDVAPSTELRRWYNHSPDRFAEFRRRYLAEIAAPDHRAAVDRLRALADHGDVVLLTATRDVEHSQAAVLAQLINENSGRST